MTVTPSCDNERVLADRSCSVDGCERPHYGKGYCALHYQRMWRNGNLEIKRTKPPRNDLAGENNRFWRGDATSTTGAHRRVRKARGPASDHSCVDCGGTAKEWAYDHKDPEERAHPQGAFSLKVEHYQPMCVSCHRRFDRAGDNLRKGRRSA